VRFLETDVLLRYFTRDDKIKARDVLVLLRRVEANSERVILSPLVVFEAVFTLQSYYKVSRREIRDMVLAIINLRGLVLENKTVFERALELYAEMNIPFADAFNSCYMRAHGIEEIYTYDQDYDGVEGVIRIQP